MRSRDKARSLRKRLTVAEVLLWQKLRNHQFHRLQFRRQYPVSNRYILDFYCPELKLGIEIDGSIHNSQETKEYDAFRAKELSAHGIRLIRFTNDEITKDMENVLKQIKMHQANPSPPRGEGWPKAGVG